MCLASAGQVIAIQGNKAEINYDGIIKTAGCDLVPSLKIGDWVLVHAGFIIQILDDKYAKELYELNKEVGNE